MQLPLRCLACQLPFPLWAMASLLHKNLLCTAHHDALPCQIQVHESEADCTLHGTYVVSPLRERQ